jgi:dipeptidyl aminopeptidase/acylaminoacyl peptidase
MDSIEPEGGASRPRLVLVVILTTGMIASLWLVLTMGAASRSRLPLPPGRPGLLVAGRPGELLLVDGRGSIVGRATTGETTGVAAWSRDGTRLAHAEGNLEHPDLVVTDPELTELVRFRLPGPAVAPLSWSPDDRQIAFTVVSASSSQVFVLDVQPGAVPRPITDPDLNALAPSWAPDGDVIAIRGGVGADQQALFIVRPDGSGLARLSRQAHAVDFCSLSWTPDGRSIVFGTGSGTAAIWSIDRDGADERRLTPSGVPSSCPSVAPDGARIGFVQWQDGGRRLAVLGRDDHDALVPAGPPWDRGPGIWSPDGRSIAMNGRPIGGPSQRAFLDPAGASPAVVSDQGDAVLLDWQRLQP